MIAYKAFNEKLQATMGKGVFQFEPGKTYEESECKCAHNGFHCAENPLCTLNYYDGTGTRFFVVKAEGDINQDGYGTRISCTRLTLIKEIDLIQLATLACMYMQKYPEREPESRYVLEKTGKCDRKDSFIIVRGKSPEAAGVKGSFLFLLKEARRTKEIEGVYPVFVDGEEVKENIWYRIRGGKICEKRN
ncbi:MAG: hypothetical protein HDQ97_19340 [Lachnospiraceae bacterium]|nr:hypothetical protein [Lachnospiraceae bacterium]